MGNPLIPRSSSRLDNASLDTAVQALKGAPYGPVRLGIAKPVVEEAVEISSGGNNNVTASINEYEEVCERGVLHNSG